MPAIFTTRELADLLGTDEWRIRRLFESGALAEPARFAGKRAIPRELIPTIVDLLRARGWLPTQAPAGATAPIDGANVEGVAP